jgi:hypothetical protein
MARRNVRECGEHPQSGSQFDQFQIYYQKCNIWNVFKRTPSKSPTKIPDKQKNASTGRG